MAARNLQTGKWYRLYKIPQTGKGFAILLERKLIGHYPHFARFQNEHGFVECFTYNQLASMLRKPGPGTKIIREKDAEKKLARMEGKRP